MADPSAAMPPLAVLTRPSGRNEALAARLRAHGWEACVLPALEILPLDCLEGLPMPEDYDMVVFVSGNAARLYLDQLTRARGGFSWPRSDRRHCRPGQRARPARTARLWREYNSPASADRRAQPRFRSPVGRAARTARAARAHLAGARHAGPRLAGRHLAAHGVRVARHAAYDRQPAVWEAQSLAPLKRRAEAGLPATWLITSGRAPTPRSPICGPPACKPGGKAAVSC
ncbi:uroporphyrinogen-III synthase [Achromobacter xylosoxidans]